MARTTKKKTGTSARVLNKSEVLKVIGDVLTAVDVLRGSIFPETLPRRMKLDELRDKGARITAFETSLMIEASKGLIRICRGSGIETEAS